MTDKQKAEIRKLLEEMPKEDVLAVKRMASAELDARHGVTKYTPRWDAGLSTR